ncbi:MAG: ThuA domain-containing protein [Gemmataceae bacterium]|nr:ThuA domain-containing protein [Gemmataceae bacterium]MDW8267517.1 ThuA domain-containing protein [Gemmataceae bacterium]
MTTSWLGRPAWVVGCLLWLVPVGVASADQAAPGKAFDPYDQSDIPLEVDATDPKLTKIVLVAGKQSHGPGEHEFFAGTAILFKMLQQTPGVFPVMARDGWPKNEKIFQGAKSTVFYMDGRAGHPIIKPDRMELLQKLMDQGAGFVNLHYAVDYPPEQGRRILGWLGGFYDASISVNPHWVADFRSLPEHPITRGVKPFSIRDEWYYNMHFIEGLKNVTPILRAIPPDDTRRTADAKKHLGREEIVAWTYERANGGRGFGFTGGHHHRNWGDPNFRRLVVNAILWTAHVEIPPEGAKVDLDPIELEKRLDRKPPKKK